MRGLPIILSFIHIEFNKFNNTGERMLVSIYNVTFKITSYHIFGVNNVKNCRNVLNIVMDVIT